MTKLCNFCREIFPGILHGIQKHTWVTFYALSIGVIGLGGTSRMSEIRGAGVWSDFEILTVNFRKIYGVMVIDQQKKNPKSEN